MKRYATALVLLLAAPAAGDFVVEVWGNGPLCHHKGTMKVTDQRIVEFDLSALPRGAKIQRAVLRASIQRRGYRQAIQVCPLAAGEKEPPPDVVALPLRRPWYGSFDADEALRNWQKNSAGPFRTYFKFAPGWKRQSTTLEIAYQGKAAEPTPRVTALRAVYHDGQTFLTWKEHEDVMAGTEPAPATLEKLEQKLLPLRGKREYVYRVYAHDRPIAIESIAEAELVAEVPFVLSAYFLDSVRTIEHPNRQRGEGSTPFVGGARARRDPLPRYVVAKGHPPLPRGCGLYVRTITKPGKTYYAVVTAVNGREAAGDLGSGNSLDQPVEEHVAPPGPIWQSQYVRKATDRQQVPWAVGRYNFWLEMPYANIPRQLQVAIGHPEEIDPAKKLPLYVHLGSYGSQADFNAHHSGGDLVVLCPPYDQDDPMFQGRHECMGTYKSYGQGVVHNWAQRRCFALMDYAKRRFPIDGERVTLRGQFCCWALRHGQKFTVVVGDAYGNISKSREAQKHGWTWGPYPQGSKNWAGVDHWEWMNICKFVRENPTQELPFYVSLPYSASHVGDIGPWAWQELYRALHDTKRAFTARWGNCWAGGTPASAMAGQIKLHQSLPAFGNCSLDDNPGDGAFDVGAVGSDGDPSGNINGYQFWDTDTIVDEPDRWEMTVYLYGGDAHGRGVAPADSCTTDLTPRRCQKFKAKPGETFKWTNTSLKDNEVIQSGSVKADRWGLVTVKKAIVSKGKNRIKIWR